MDYKRARQFVKRYSKQTRKERNHWTIGPKKPGTATIGRKWFQWFSTFVK